jgi:hypothetical protein
MRARSDFMLCITAAVVEELDKALILDPPKFSFKRSYFYYVIDLLISKELINRNKHNTFEKENYYFLNKKLLRKRVKSNIDSYIKYLENHSIVLTDNQFVVGAKSKHYAINPKLLDNREEFLVPVDSKLYKAVQKNYINSKAHISRWPKHLKVMRKEFMNIDYDFDGAYSYIDQCDISSRKKTLRGISVSNLKNGRRRYFGRNKTNSRLDTNLTNMKKELRRFIKGNYVEIDLKNSQPYLFGELLKVILGLSLLCYQDPELNLLESIVNQYIQTIPKHNLIKKKYNLVSFSSFIECSMDGTLYEFIRAGSKRDISRDDAKKSFIVSMYSQNYKGNTKFIPYKEEKQLLRNAFPELADLLFDLKLSDNKQLAIFLQRVESFIFIDYIAKKLVENGIIPLTIHDSVIVKQEHYKKALEICKQAFNKIFGIIPRFDVEKLIRD